ncbi:hypothetical protein M569_11725, partial [Genlisea aurea]
RHSRFGGSVPGPVTLIALCGLPLLLIFEVYSFVTQTKTIAGHNLDPTPWHVFPAQIMEPVSKYSTASTMFRCIYLTCGAAVPAAVDSRQNRTPPVSCPRFFGNIHRDLEPWAVSKISRDHVTAAKEWAAFRVVVVAGKLYVEFYYACVQSRAMFTVWGFLQLLRRFPGMIPDVDLMFDCMDKPTINRTEHDSMPLPIFRYCTSADHLDIPFPDWSFWGWPEINIEPWDVEFQSIKQGSRRRSWARKWPLAYWKGNPGVVSPIRLELLQCNHSRTWRAQIMIQDWEAAVREGFKDSKLSAQCDYRYKIYAEGYAWSVSLKYILACGSCPLIISPRYHDFFSRGLVPEKNYLPIPSFDICREIKSTVDWGNAHSYQAEAIGRGAQDFMADLNMDRVYDYMYHVVREYSKLQTFKPVRPSSSFQVCEESVFCFSDERQKEWLRKAAAEPAEAPPCTLP